MNMKNRISEIPLFKKWKRNQQKKNFTSSANYWEERYKHKGNSGSGSYKHLAEFKSEVLNEFVINHNINTVLEFGCGDGNQLTFANYPTYIGLDVATTAIKMCYDRFTSDYTKSFFLYDSLAFHDRTGIFKADLVLSLDVIFHLVELEIFENYIRHLFQSSTKFVIIYASDYDQEVEPIYRHEHRRNFTIYIDKNIRGWKLREMIKNKYPADKYKEQGSLSDFYIFEKTVDI